MMGHSIHPKTPFSVDVSTSLSPAWLPPLYAASQAVHAEKVYSSPAIAGTGQQHLREYRRNIWIELGGVHKRADPKTLRTARCMIREIDERRGIRGY